MQSSAGQRRGSAGCEEMAPQCDPRGLHFCELGGLEVTSTALLRSSPQGRSSSSPLNSSTPEHSEEMEWLCIIKIQSSSQQIGDPAELDSCPVPEHQGLAGWRLLTQVFLRVLDILAVRPPQSLSSLTPVPHLPRARP